MGVGPGDISTVEKGSPILNILKIANLVRWQLEQQYGDLRGLNDIAARSMFLHLADKGIQCRLVRGVLKTDKDVELFELIGPVDHYWVEADDQVVDVLADLFNPLMDTPFPKVYVGPSNGRYVGDPVQ